jgi:hypothetical protein
MLSIDSNSVNNKLFKNTKKNFWSFSMKILRLSID